MLVPDQMTPEDIHKRDAPIIIDSIVRPTLEAGGDMTNVLGLLETVIVGVLISGVRESGDKMVIDKLFEQVTKRVAELRRAEKAKVN